MSQGNELLRAILMKPECDTTRLVYADWLQENGDPERAEFIRLQITKSKGLTSEAYIQRKYLNVPILERRQFMSLISNAPNWFNLLALGSGRAPKPLKDFKVHSLNKEGDLCMQLKTKAARGHSFACNIISRGFLSETELTLTQYLARAEWLFSAQPICSVYFLGMRPENLGYGYSWFNEPAGASYSSVPDEIWTGNESLLDYVYETPGDCSLALSKAAVNYGRKQAGLM